MPTLTVERTIAAPPADVFGWLADSSHYTAAPLVLRERRVRDGAGAPYGVGARREVFAGAWLREEITAYDPPRSLAYRIVASVPAIDHEHGSIRVDPTIDGGSHVTWTTTFAIPRAWGGAPATRLTAPILTRTFNDILTAAERELGGPPADAPTGSHVPFAVMNRVVNPAMAAVLRSPRLHSLLSGRLALITVRGRRTGRFHTLPVMYQRQGDAVTIAVEWPERKRWWRNVRGGAPVELVLAGTERHGTAVAREDDAGGVTVEVRLETDLPN